MRGRTTSWGTGLWKEWRDQRAIALALLVALPVLVLSAAWAFGDKLAPPAFAALGVLTLPLAQGLFVIAVASELFGSERRRGTLALVQRLPGGLGRALAGKLLAYAAGTLLALLAGTAVAALACALFGPPGSVGEVLARAAAPGADPLLALLLLGLFAFGCWVLLLSLWVPQGGAAVLGALLLLALLALPAALLLSDHLWLVERTARHLLAREASGALAGGALLAALPLLALGVSHLRGQRRLAGVWAPAWRGLAVLGALTLGGYAYGAVEVARATRVDPTSEDFRIEDLVVGAGGRYAYVNAFAGPRPFTGATQGTWETGTPLKPLCVDLRDGSWREAAGFGQAWMRPYYPGGHGSSTTTASHVLLPATDGEQITWFDAAAGTALKTIWHSLESAEVRGWQRSVRAHDASRRDEQGRALWVEGGALVREGDPLPAAPLRRDAWSYAVPIPGGWLVTRRASNGPTVTLEAATGRERPVPHEWRQPYMSRREWLSPRHMLVWEMNARGVHARTLVIHDLDAPETPPRTVSTPEGFAWLAGPTDDGRLLAIVGTAAPDRRLVLWAPVTGEVTPLRDARGGEVPAFGGWGVARAPQDLWLLDVRQDGVSAASVPLLVDARAGRAARLAPVGYVTDWVLEGPQGALAVEDRRRIVRLGADGRRELLFPR